MLGNGFDLHHELPTTYICFLKTIEYIINNDVEPYVSAGKIFNEVGKECTQVFRSYKKYNDIYDDLILNPSVISNINEIGRDNVWLNYFLKTYNKDVGWIDLETEIEMIVNTIENSFPLLKDDETHNADQTTRFVLSCFDYFIEKKPPIQHNSNGLVYVVPGKTVLSDKYKTEYPLGSGVFKCDYNSIIDELFKQLNDLVKLLELYLTSFVENALNKCMGSNSNAISVIKQFGNNEDRIIISLNYTHTVEVIYDIQPERIVYVHGSVGKGNMVLGINSNAVTENNYSIKFRKYYQRTMYDTDTEYNLFLFNSLRHIYNDGPKIDTADINVLNVFGHSLDVSDRDIIEALFARSEAINIYYHNDDSKDIYIRNLIKIFGKEEFEKLRINKQLCFILIR